MARCCTDVKRMQGMLGGLEKLSQHVRAAQGWPGKDTLSGPGGDGMGWLGQGGLVPPDGGRVKRSRRHCQCALLQRWRLRSCGTGGSAAASWGSALQISHSQRMACVGVGHNESAVASTGAITSTMREVSPPATRWRVRCECHPCSTCVRRSSGREQQRWVWEAAGGGGRTGRRRAGGGSGGGRGTCGWRPGCTRSARARAPGLLASAAP